ncbi:MAG: addiction module protein [Acidobacteria bacterium]|nr:addiction module protein [Acidobacteriota bacterium]
MRSVAEIEMEALSLEPESRARIASRLIESLEDASAVDEEAVEALWLAEAEERIRQIEAGEVVLLDSSEVLETLRERRG